MALVDDYRRVVREDGLDELWATLIHFLNLSGMGTRVGEAGTVTRLHIEAMFEALVCEFRLLRGLPTSIHFTSAPDGRPVTVEYTEGCSIGCDQIDATARPAPRERDKRGARCLTTISKPV